MSAVPSDLDAVIEAVRRQLWLRQTGTGTPEPARPVELRHFEPLPATLEQLLAEAEGRMRAEGQAPTVLTRFPFSRMKWLQRMALRLERWVTKPSREAQLLQIECIRGLLQWMQQASDNMNQLNRVADRDLVVLAMQRESARLNEQFSTLRLMALGQRPSAAPEAPPPEPAVSADPAEDALYLAFENRFRGPYETVKKRLSAYLPLLAQLPESDAPFLDIGCGRGEWLDLMADAGLPARGIDTNQAAVALCAERGLLVECADAFACLAAQPDASLRVVSAFHLIEHLPYQALLRLLDEIRRVLIPGGMMLLETPNPCNIMVGANDFWRDMTHLRPVHPDTLVFLAQARGYAPVRGYFFLETPSGVPSLMDMADYKFECLDSYVWISRDYGIAARKPETR